MAKVFRINTRERTVVAEKFKDEYKFFGNRGLVAKFLNDEVNPKCDPLSAENKLVVCTGIFGGTPLSTANRVSFGAKSPLTGTIKESNVGGNLGLYLNQHGIKMIIFEDLPADDSWYYVLVNKEGNVELLPADDYLGLGTYDFIEKMYELYGKKIGVAALGVAGERKYKVASIMVSDGQTGYPTRAAGRGGLGAVLGTKQIKGIVVEAAANRYQVPYVDKERFDRANKKFVTAVLNDPETKGLNAAGTHGILEPNAAINILPVRNFSGELAAKEDIEKVGVEALHKINEERGGKKGQPCQPGCLVKCANIYNDSDGNFLTGGLEYETIALCGPNCDIYDLDFIAKVDRLLDDFGIDTIDIGDALAVCMENGKIAWGDKEGVLALLDEMFKGTEFGNALGNGTAAVCEYLGAKRVPTVKGQAIPAYDPRTMKGQGVTYSVSNMGADHTTGNTIVIPDLDHAAKEGKVQLVKELQVGSAVADNVGCMFCVTKALNPELFPEMFAGVFGGEWDMDKVLDIGVQTLLLEKKFNEAAGFTDEDKKLPEFFSTEKTATDQVWNITLEELKEAELF